MKTRILLALFLFVSLYGCYEDKGNYDYKVVNEVHIKLITNQEDFIDKGGYSIGDTVKVSPKLTFTWDEGDTTRLGFEWVFFGEVISRERELEWIADTVGDFYTGQCYLVIHDSTSGVNFMSEDAANFVVFVNDAARLKRGWLVVDKRNNKHVIDYVSYNEMFDPLTFQSQKIWYAYKDIFADRNDGLELGGTIKDITCFFVEDFLTNESHVLILQEGGIGPVYVDGKNFQKTISLADEFVGGSLPQGVNFVRAYDKGKGSVLVTDDGQVYSRRKDDPMVFYSGKFLDFPVVIDKGIDAGPFVSYRGDDFYSLTFDKKNKRFLVLIDKYSYIPGFSNGGVISEVYQEPSEEFTMTNNMGDVEMLYYGLYKEGVLAQDNKIFALYKNNNSGKEGQYYYMISKITTNFGSGPYELVPILEANFPDDNLLDGKNVFAITPRDVSFIMFSGGAQHDKLYGYLFGDEGGIEKARLLYDFKGKKIKNIEITGLLGGGGGVSVGIGLSDCMCTMDIQTSDFVDGVKDEKIKFLDYNFGEVQFIKKLFNTNMNW